MLYLFCKNLYQHDSFTSATAILRSCPQILQILSCLAKLQRCRRQARKFFCETSKLALTLARNKLGSLGTSIRHESRVECAIFFSQEKYAWWSTLQLFNQIAVARSVTYFGWSQFCHTFSVGRSFFFASLVRTYICLNIYVCIYVSHSFN